MIYFEKLNLDIKATKPESDINEDFGRHLEFDKGLNIVSGDNTSGKTSLAKCLYYILGVEEIIDGKKNSAAMDRSAYIEFSYKPSSVDKSVIMKVQESSVMAQLCNSNNQHITLFRELKSKDKSNFQSILVWESEMDKITQETPPTMYYIHNIDDHNTELPFGFYSYLSFFAGITISKVPTRTGTDYPLYLQTLFALDFIEQTKGWTDYFATIRQYNFLQPRQRIIEYALGLRPDDDIKSIKQYQLENESIKKLWEKKVKLIKSQLTYNNLFVDQLESEIDKQRKQISEIQIFLISGKETIDSYLKELNKQINSLQDSIKPTDDERTDRYESMQNNYRKRLNRCQVFLNKLAEDKCKQNSIIKQIDAITEEVKRNQNIMKVSNLISYQQMRICPTCHQKLDLTNAGSIDVNEDKLDANIKQQNTQKSFLVGLQKSLQESIAERELYVLYYKKVLKQEKEKLNILYEDTVQNEKRPSEEILMEIAERKQNFITYGIIKEQITPELQNLSPLKKKYDFNKAKIKELKDSQKETDNVIVYNLQKLMRSYLCSMRYQSNNPNTVTLALNDSASNYLYLPQAKVEQYEEPLRSISSASDFVRSIWSYNLALLKIGPLHPGFLLMDEPCQHSINETDLKTLFRKCAEIKDKQIILFCSSEPKTDENIHKNDIHKTNIETMLCELNKSDYNLIQMHMGEKSVNVINESEN